MRTPEARSAILGSFDGAVSTIGVLAGLLAARAPATTILTVAVGLAVAAAAGMAAGDWLSGSTPRVAAVMGAATLLGSVVPALPVAAWPGPVGVVVAAVLVAALAVAIAEAHTSRVGRPRAYTATLTVLVAAAGLSAGAALLLGAAG